MRIRQGLTLSSWRDISPEMASSAFPILYAHRLDAMTRFYRDSLGMKENYRFPPEGEASFVTLLAGTSELGLGTYEPTPGLEGRPLVPPTNGRGLEMCVYVDDVAQLVDTLRANGTRVLVEPRDMPWGERVAYVADPEENSVMLVTKLEESPPGVITIGGPVDELSVTLGIHGDDVNPDELTAVLGQEPSHAHRVGDTHVGSRTGATRVRKNGVWLLRVRGKPPQTADDLVAELLTRLPKDEILWQDLAKRFQIDLSFGVFMEGCNRGFELSSELVQVLARREISLSFDIYAP